MKQNTKSPDIIDPKKTISTVGVLKQGKELIIALAFLSVFRDCFGMAVDGVVAFAGKDTRFISLIFASLNVVFVGALAFSGITGAMAIFQVLARKRAEKALNLVNGENLRLNAEVERLTNLNLSLTVTDVSNG